MDGVAVAHIKRQTVSFGAQRDNLSHKRDRFVRGGGGIINRQPQRLAHRRRMPLIQTRVRGNDRSGTGQGHLHGRMASQPGRVRDRTGLT